MNYDWRKLHFDDDFCKGIVVNNAKGNITVNGNLKIPNSNVKIVSIGSGLSMGFLGNSHFGLEDISIIRSIPNIPIICPCDCFEVYKAVEALSKYQGPAFLRLTGAPPTSIIYTEDYEYSFQCFKFFPRNCWQCKIYF